MSVLFTFLNNTAIESKYSVSAVKQKLYFCHRNTEVLHYSQTFADRLPEMITVINLLYIYRTVVTFYIMSKIRINQSPKKIIHTI